MKKVIAGVTLTLFVVPSVIFLGWYAVVITKLCISEGWDVIKIVLLCFAVVIGAIGGAWLLSWASAQLKKTT